MSKWVFVGGRALLAMLFVFAGSVKLFDPEPFLAHMAAHHVPGQLLPLVIALELGAGFALMTGIVARPAAAVLGLFCIATALVFHADWTEHVERTLFFKDIAIAGGLLCLAALSSHPEWPRPPHDRDPG
jgi:putative oxidoreductase